MTITILWWHAPALVTALLFVSFWSLRKMPYIKFIIPLIVVVSGLVWLMGFAAHMIGR